MGEIIEEFFNGYCRNFDMTQTVICEYEQLPQELHLIDSSCEFGTCQYSKDCTLMKQALAREKA
ncbi:MAG: ubiquinone biosynthesis protein UbiE [Eubacteriales bacterium]|nr:ubiquinone biosynthesis protein UbiE [Eubacteriales bacterium]